MRAILDGDALATLGKITLLMVFATSYCLHVVERVAPAPYLIDTALTAADGVWFKSYTGSGSQITREG
jgi:hypothetical protein